MSKMPLEQIALEVRAAKRPHLMTTAIIAVDGCGGAGKSTFAGELSKLLGNCSVIHTDDFASWDNPINWFKKMLDEVLLPLKQNKPAHFQRYNWAKKHLDDWINIDPQPFVILEGVSSARKEFRPFLSFSFFVETSRDSRLQRGLERDGETARTQWLKWMDEEDQYLNAHKPEQFVDVILSGEHSFKEPHILKRNDPDGG